MKTKIMRLLKLLVIVMLISTVVVSPAYADKPVTFDPSGKETGWVATGCTTIQSGLITDSAGVPLTVGFDEFGYNYQAHMFNGTYDTYDRVADGLVNGSPASYANDRLEMKWSDEWIANVDCNGDYRLDRGLMPNSTSPTGTSMGWTTNHVSGTYIDEYGETQHYTYFVKIQYMGPGGSLWGAYEVVQEVYNDPADGYHGLLVKTDPGLGHDLSQ